ncbi:MAG: PDZ domain-containing protein [Verrucomicrobia bacterium]|nr:PDZ domain-containing protein [Verrucomicrobiota bacterium]
MTMNRSFLSATLLLAAPGFLADAAKAPDVGPVSPNDAATRPALGDSEAERAAIQRAVDAVYPALVRIHVVYEEGREGRMEKNRATGSGAIISEDGYVLTNHHVAGRATRVVCRLSNREEVDAVVVGTDALSDLCILKLDLASRRDPKAKLPVAKFGNSDHLTVGDVVLAMGSPAGLSQSVTKGIVSNTAMILPNNLGSFILDGERVGELVRWIGHDAVIYPGNSGGPLVNLQGEIVGVNEVGVGSLGGAIPSNVAQAVAKELIAKGTVTRSWIGIDVQPLLKQMADAKGVLVSAVLPDSPAKSAGLEPGDFITRFNGDSVLESRSEEDIPVFNRLVLGAPVGAKVTLKGLRAGQPMTWPLTTVAREPNLAKEIEIKNWGLTARSFTRVSALESHRKTKQGVFVDSVRPGGPCAEAKPALKNEDILTKVNGQEIADVDALIAFTKEFTKGSTEPKPVLVTFERDTQELVTVAKVGPEIQDDKPSRPAKAWLGVQTQVLTSDLAEALGLEGKKGVRVTQVVPGSPADVAGVKVGDLLLKLDGQVIAARTQSDQELFENLVRQYKVGTEAELEGVRSGQALKLTAKLGRQPKPNSELDEYKDDQFEFKARDLSLTDRIDERLKDDEKGVRVSSIQNAGWAALGGLGSGDILVSIDGQPTESIAALKKIMAKLRDTKPRRVSFFIKRGIRTQYLEMEPKW